MKPTKADFEMRHEMEATIDFIVRNYEELPAEHKNKDILYSFSTSLFYHLVNQKLEDTADENLFFKHLWKLSVMSEYSRIQLITYYTSPKTGLVTLVPTQVLSNLTDMPLNTMTEIMEYQQSEENLSIILESTIIEKIQEEDDLPEKEILKHCSILIYAKVDYAKDLLEYDEKKIREELVLQEQSLREQLKKTGRFKSLKRESIRL